MDTSPIPGFITRKHAAEKCKRAERTLQRYWSKAIELRRENVLQHLKLRTEDGKVINGPDVTKDLIDQLKKKRQNPTWFVHASWVVKTYGTRLDTERAEAQQNGEPRRRSQSTEVDDDHSGNRLIAQYEQRLAEKDERITDLQKHKQQLRKANDALTTLTEQITGMLGHYQIKVLGPAQYALVPADDRRSDQVSDEKPEQSKSTSRNQPNTADIVSVGGASTKTSHSQINTSDPSDQQEAMDVSSGATDNEDGAEPEKGTRRNVKSSSRNRRRSQSREKPPNSKTGKKKATRTKSQRSRRPQAQPTSSTKSRKSNVTTKATQPKTTWKRMWKYLVSGK